MSEIRQATGAAAEQPAGEAMQAGAGKRRRHTEKTGVVVKAKMQKTVVVSVERLVRHPLYHKILRRTSTFMAHDELGAQRGDTVRIVETRPLSRRKRWRVREIVKRAVLVEEPRLEALSE
jgi:small subunit ribosomal protein S17